MSKARLSEDKALQANSFLHTLQPVEQLVGVMHRQGSADLRVKFAEELAQLRETAHQEGFDAGYNDGFRAGQESAVQQFYQEKAADLNAFKSGLEEARDSVLKAQQEWFELADPKIGELAVLIAAKIIQSELTTNNEIIVEITKHALAEVTNAEQVRIRLNPFDKPALADHKEELMAISPSVRQVEIVEDASIAGGCVIESDGGAVDATIQTKIENVLSSLRGEL